MEEPTYRQHQILVSIQQKGNTIIKSDDESDLDLYWELVRMGYLKSIVTLTGGSNWKFILLDKATEYLKYFIVKPAKKKINNSKIKSLTRNQLFRIFKVIIRLDDLYSTRLQAGAERVNKLEKDVEWAKSIIQKHRSIIPR